MNALIGWIQQHQQDLELLGAISLGTFVLTLILLPIAIVYLPEDYFIRHRRQPAAQEGQHPLVWAALTAAKNILGTVFVLAGLAMLVLPGQGLLTILIGIVLMNFPGKYALEQRFVRRGAIRRTLNRIRSKAGKPPFLVGDDPGDVGAGPRACPPRR